MRLTQYALGLVVEQRYGTSVPGILPVIVHMQVHVQGATIPGTSTGTLCHRALVTTTRIYIYIYVYMSVGVECTSSLNPVANLLCHLRRRPKHTPDLYCTILQYHTVLNTLYSEYHSTEYLSIPSTIVHVPVRIPM